MTWVRLDDGFTEGDRIVHLSDGAFRLFVAALCYCNRKLTDGFVPKVRLPMLVPKYKPALATELIKSGLWHDRGEQFEVDDYLSFQPSADKVRAKQASYSERGKKGAQARWGDGCSDGNKHGYSHSNSHEESDSEHGYADAPSVPSVPLVGKDSSSVESEEVREDSTDDPFVIEAKRRLADELASGRRIKNPAGYVSKTVTNLHLEGWTPAPPKPEPWKPCGYCDEGWSNRANGVVCPCHPKYEEIV